jgi:DNA-binding CsgD family transcriptional regulator
MEALAAVPEGEAMPSKDCAQLLRVSSDLYLLDDSANLPAQLLRSLGTLVPHELGGCHWIEPSQQHIAAFYDPAFPELDCPNNQKSYKNFWQLAENHPLHDLLFSHPMRAWKLSDVISRRAFQETDLYRTVYAGLGVECEMSALLPDSTKPGAFFLLSLQRGRDDFSERDRTLVNLLLPHVVNAYQYLGASTPARTRPVPKEPQQFREWILHRTHWELTPRESEVLFWLCQGKTNSEIGRILGIAERTAETHALRIYPKMGVENRYTAIATMTRLSIGQVD